MSIKPFFYQMDELDSIVQADPSPEVLCRFEQLTQNKILLSYVFAKISDERWLKELFKTQYFAAPYSGKKDDKIGNIVYDPWPQSDFLARMASKAPDTVLRIALSIKTDNISIHEGLARAALVMSTDLAAQWVENEVLWLAEHHALQGFYEENLGKLISKLARGGEPTVALRLAAELLAVMPDPDEKKKLKIEDEIQRLVQGSLEPTTRCDRYYYEQVLKNNIPDLAKAAPFETLEMLCSLLKKAIVYSQRDGEKNEPHDATFVWRPAIEDNEQNKDYKIDCPLITAIRDTAEGVCKRNPEKIGDVVVAVEKHGWNVFKRIGIHLLRVATDAPIDMIEKRLVSRDLLIDHDCHHEYYHLLSEKFRVISEAGRQQILRWIEQGEDLKDRDDLSPERKAQRKLHWQHRILTAIKDDLPSAGKAWYDELESKCGKPSMPPDFTTYSGGATWKGPESPKKADQLALMPIAELIAFLKEWKPSGEWMAPTPDGLGSVLGDLVMQQPERFITDIELFKDSDMDPTYIRHMISGFCRVAESEKPIAYDAVFIFCRWVLDQWPDSPRLDLPEELKDGIDVDRSWHYARSEVVRFVEKSLGEKAKLPFNLRAEVFEIIQPLTDDPEPDLAYENKSSMDPLTLSLNTIRGKALHAVMAYAMWVNRNIRDDIKAKEGRNPNFSDMPEVLPILNKHLDARNDPSRASRAVYGQWLPQLVYLGSDWVLANMKRLFPREPELKPLRDAVWHTYLLYGGQLYSSVTKSMMSVYREEVAGLKDRQIGEKSYESPNRRLAEHVVIMYLWGGIELGDDSLLDLLFKTAPTAITTHVMDFIGRDIFRNKDIEPKIIKRMIALWTWRVEQVGGFDRMPVEELSAFGWWFASGKFEPEWALRNLEETLRWTPINAANLQAIEQLSNLYSVHPVEVLRCLKLFVQVNSDLWFFVSSHKQKGVWTILEQGMASDNVAIRDQAEEIVHLLGSKGYLEYRELLQVKRGMEIKGEETAK